METETVQKPKIEAIYPLTAMQQNLLFHHLMEGEDQGFLLVECTLEGHLDMALFKQAWRKTIQRHEVLRASVHWKKVKHPMIVIRPEMDVNLTFLDWSDSSMALQEQQLITYKNKRRSEPINFEKAPLANVSIIKKANHSYYFIWDCHHLLLDGWSSTTVLKDVFSFYKDLSTYQAPVLPTIPSYKSYKNWKDRLSSDIPSKFWKESFNEFSKGSRFRESVSSSNIRLLDKNTHTFTDQETEQLKALAKYHKVTLNSLFQGIWTLLLAKYFKQNDIVFGTTVSGRSISFPNIEQMVGMFTNVLPVRVPMDTQKPWGEIIRSLQLHQQEARNFEYAGTNEILSWGGISEGKTPYNSLFVFENYPHEDIGQGVIKVSGFKSGVTTTYPVSIILKVEDQIQYDLFIDPNSIDNNTASWLQANLQLLCKILLAHKEAPIAEILAQLPSGPESKANNTVVQEYSTSVHKEEKYLPPRTHTELQLLEIWEQLFMTNYIGVYDNFFDLGGKSLLSVKMFRLIEKQLDIKLPPTTLLEHPTIADLAKLIDNHAEGETVSPWKFLVPIKARGNKRPLFCIHAGGGHVFFFKDLAHSVDKQRPVYALQPVGIYGEDNKHEDIQAMARDYADEISIAQPEGILNIVVYCFSTAVGLEMAAYLKTKGRQTNIIVADTIAEHRLLLDKARFKVRLFLFLKRFMKRPFKALTGMIGYRIFYYLNPLKVKLFGTPAEKNTEQMRLHLVHLFNNYNWQTKIDKISLILTEKIAPEYNEATINSWKPLVSEDIKVVNCIANHINFFELPDVQNTAKAIEEVIL